MNSATLSANRPNSSMLCPNPPKLSSNIGQRQMTSDPDSAYLHRHGSPSALVVDEDRLPKRGESREGAKGNGVGECAKGMEKEEDEEDKPSVDIFINNVVCAFSVRCHLNLRKIGQLGSNVEYKREYGKVNMRFRHPSGLATIWSSGKITITGNNSEASAKQTARKCARALQKMGFNVRLSSYKVVNVLGTCSMPFAIRIRDFSEHHPKAASYEPELHPAVTYKLLNPRATLKVFSTGSITITAPAVDNINEAVQHIYPLVESHKMPLSEATIQKRLERKRKLGLIIDDDEENTDEEFANEGADDDDDSDDDYSSGDSS